jgi:hypothetical protein
VSEMVALMLILLLALSGYAAGRLHGQVGYRVGYRFGYQQGYFDGDRASWHRRRRELQAAVAAVLKTPPVQRPEAYPLTRPVGTTYASNRHDDADPPDPPDPGDRGPGHHARVGRVRVGRRRAVGRVAAGLRSVVKTPRRPSQI